MRRLLAVELRRLRARGAVGLLVLLGLASTLLLGWAAYSSAQPMSEAQIAQAEEAWELAQRDWEENGEQQLADCLEMQEAESELTGDDADYGCDQLEPQREWYVWEPPTFGEFTQSSLPSALLVVCLVALLIGVTFVAAEFSTGSIGTGLTFEPRRGRVFASKTVAAALGGLAFGLLWAAGYLGATAAGFAAADGDVVITAPLIHSMLRVGVLGLAIAVVGTGLAFVLRHSAAALGVAVGYLIGVDLILLLQLPGGSRWRLVDNIAAWTNGSATYYVDDCTVDATGTVCEYVERTISMTQGGLVLLGVTLVATAVALVTFRHRDI